MTPAQRHYDEQLTLSLRNMATWIAPRSRKMADALNLAADRIDALSTAAPIEPQQELDLHGQIKQPASQPDRVTTGPNERNALDRRNASLNR